METLDDSLDTSDKTGSITSLRAAEYTLRPIPIHKTLRVTPAMQAGLSDRVFEMADLVALIEDAEAPKPANLSESDSR